MELILQNNNSKKIYNIASIFLFLTESFGSRGLKNNFLATILSSNSLVQVNNFEKILFCSPFYQKILQNKFILQPQSFIFDSSLGSFSGVQGIAVSTVKIH